MKNIFITAVTLFMLAASMTSRAGLENTNGLVGLWEGVDPVDGSHPILSITSNGDGTVKLLIYDTFWTLCDGGRGLAQGTTTVSTEQSLVVDDYTITCFESDDTLKTPVTFIRNSDNTLTEVSTTSVFMPIIYYRTSK